MMINNNQKKTFFVFAIGAAIGASLGYLFGSGKKDKIVNDVKDAAGKMKEKIKKDFNV